MPQSCGGMARRQKQVPVQAFPAHPSVEPVAETILRRLANQKILGSSATSHCSTPIAGTRLCLDGFYAKMWLIIDLGPEPTL